MKALAIDSSTSCIVFAARNEDNNVQLSLDIGMHQSEQILPSIYYVLETAGIKPEDLDFTALSLGPGTFTGLRLAFAALKALTLANNTPIYGIPTLEALALPFANWNGAVIPVIDAKKDRFYASIYRSGKENVPQMDEYLDGILKLLDKEEKILAVGPDASFFTECVRSTDSSFDISTVYPLQTHTAQQLLTLGEKRFYAGEKGLAEYDGPVYIRPSEAEENLLKK